MARFMLALGADGGDFIVTDPADRDAGWYQHRLGQSQHWWNDEIAATYLSWSKALSEAVGKPSVIWQIPLGNMVQNNTVNHWQDNRVDYFFSHLDQFGAAHGEQTSPETDGGNLINKTIANFQAGGALLRR
jgi:hypothetical protein